MSLPTNSPANRQPPPPEPAVIVSGDRPTVLWRDAQRREQHRGWEGVDRALVALPPRLFRQAKLLEYDLALRWSTTGQFRDIFLGTDAFPLTSIGRWLLDDLGIVPPAGRPETESHLLVASVFLAARAHLVDAILDPSSFVGREQVALIGVLAERTMTELAAVVSAGSPFWELRGSIAEDDVDDLLGDAERRRAHATSDDPTALLRPAWAGPARVLAHATMASDRAALSDRPGIDREVVAMLDALAEAVQVRDDLARMQRDVAEERPSFPIAVAARAAGLSLQPWPSPAVVLGAMVATGSLATILEAADGRLQASRKIAIDAGLPTFATYLGDVIAALDAGGRGRTMAACQPMRSVSGLKGPRSGIALARESDGATRTGAPGQSFSPQPSRLSRRPSPWRGASCVPMARFARAGRCIARGCSGQATCGRVTPRAWSSRSCTATATT